METVQSKEIKQYIVVKINKELYGIDIQMVQNIIRMDRITRVPQSPEFIKGVINLRGDIIPVMSMRTKFNLEADEYTNNTRIIIAKTNDHTMGIIVDSVKEVIQLKPEAVEDIDGLSSDISTIFIQGVGKTEDDIITLLNVEGLITTND